MTGEQPRAPSSPREGEDVSIRLERPKVHWSFVALSSINIASSLSFVSVFNFQLLTFSHWRDVHKLK